MKTVHLGKRVVPKGMRGDDSDYLNTVLDDTILTLLFASFLIWTAGFTIALVIFDPIFAPPNDLYIRVGFGLMALTDFCGLCIISWQSLRIIRYITKSIENVKAMQITQSITTENPLKITMRKIKIRTVGQVISGLPHIFVKIAVTCGVPYNVSISLLLIYGATLCSALATYVFIPKNFSMFTSSSYKNATDTDQKPSQVSPGMDDTAARPS